MRCTVLMLLCLCDICDKGVLSTDHKEDCSGASLNHLWRKFISTFESKLVYNRFGNYNYSFLHFFSFIWGNHSLNWTAHPHGQRLDVIGQKHKTRLDLKFKIIIYSPSCSPLLQLPMSPPHPLSWLMTWLPISLRIYNQLEKNFHMLLPYPTWSHISCLFSPRVHKPSMLLQPITSPSLLKAHPKILLQDLPHLFCIIFFSFFARMFISAYTLALILFKDKSLIGLTLCCHCWEPGLNPSPGI